MSGLGEMNLSASAMMLGYANHFHVREGTKKV